jgi:hypothetical protein
MKVEDAVKLYMQHLKTNTRPATVRGYGQTVKFLVPTSRKKLRG